MSFKVGQILSSTFSDEAAFLNPVYSEGELIRIDNVDTAPAGALDTEGKTFIDKGISIIGNFQPGVYYYIKLAIERNFPNIDSDLTLRLANQSDLQEVTQYIDNFTIFAPNKDSNASKYAYYETIFAPNNTYDQLRIILSRTTIDYWTESDPETGQSFTKEQRQAYRGREIKINPSLCKIAEVQDILGDTSINKLGVQGPPGLLMCINGEPIRIGPSGIYEIRNGYKVNFLGFVPGKSQTLDGTYHTDNFIVDYQYGTEN